MEAIIIFLLNMIKVAKWKIIEQGTCRQVGVSSIWMNTKWWSTYLMFNAKRYFFSAISWQEQFIFDEMMSALY